MTLDKLGMNRETFVHFLGEAAIQSLEGKIADAIQAEREACAETAEQLAWPFMSREHVGKTYLAPALVAVAREIARAIRARTAQEPEGK